MTNLLDALRGDSERRDNSYKGTAGRGIGSGIGSGTGAGTGSFFGSFLVWAVVAVWSVLMPLGAMAEEVRGIVRDGETGKPVELAGIEVEAVGAKGANGAALGGNGACAGGLKGSVGAYTDSLGRFSVGNIAAGDSLRIRVAAFSYEKYDRVVAFPKDSLRIVLNPAGKALGEVTVTAEQVRIVDGGYSITPSQNQARHSIGGYGLVDNLMIPGVEVNRDDGTILVAGEEAAIYINGVEASMRDVKSLRAKDVAKVECFIDPSGKYSSKDRVVNFVLVERTSGGYVDAVAKQNIGYAVGDLNLTARFFKNNTQYTVFGGAGYEAYGGDKSVGRDTILFPGSPVIRWQSTELEKLRSNSEYLQFQVRNTNKKRTLRADVIFNREHTPDNITDGVTSYSSQGLDNLATRSGSSSVANTETLKLFGKFDFSEAHSLNASLNARYTDNEYSYSYRQEKADNITSEVGEKLVYIEASVDYFWKINKANTLTIDGFITHKYSDATYRGTLENKQELSITEGDAFATWRYRFGGWSLMVRPGIALSRYFAHGHDVNLKVNPRFNIGIGGQPRDGQYLRFNVNIGNTFPSPSVLTAATQIVDPVEMKVGNPNLEIAKLYMPTLMYSVNIRKVGLQLYTFYLYMNRALTNCYYFADNRLVQTYRSDGDGHFFQADLSATWRPSSSFNVKGTLTYANDRYIIPATVSPVVSRFWGKIQASYYVGNLEINVDYGTPKEYATDGVSRYETSNDYGISVSYAIKGLQIEAGARNLFLKPTDRIWRTSEQYHATNETRKKKDMSHGYVRVAYSFDFGKKLKHSNDGPDRSSESAILRAN